ncbi:MAG: hypothetical protein Q9170_005672 [Blastenia crenularia]
MVRSLAMLSPFESLMLGAAKPVSMLVHFYHSRFHETTPADHLLAVLPHASILALRCVSHTTKAWVDEEKPDLLKRLRVTCPLPHFALQWNSTLRRLSHECHHLTIDLLPSAQPIPTGTLIHPSPAGQIFNIVSKFKSLRIDLPPQDAFHPLFSLRLALESASLKALVAFRIELLDIKSLIALTWGGFDSLTDSTWIGQSFWRSLQGIRIGMKTSWLEYDHEDPHGGQEPKLKMRLREDRKFYRQGIQMLHNYFSHIALQDNLVKLRFDWIGDDKIGPNPLLLDEEIAKGEGAKWFSAPGIMWKALNEVWLTGVKVRGIDVKIMKGRMKALEKLMVWEELAAPEISGELEMIKGKEWINVDLNTSFHEPEDFGDVENLIDSDDESGHNRGETMVVPFMLRI